MKTEQKSAKSTPKKAAKKATARPLARADKADGESGTSASQLIRTRIAELGDWRGDVLRHVRKLIKEADPEIVEEWKWSNPVWSHNGIVCTGESYKKVVKLTFAKGASLRDLRLCSTQASTATSAAQSTSTRETTWTRLRSRP